MIEKASGTDIPKILEIEKHLFSDPWDKALFEAAVDAEDKYFFVEKQNGETAGYIIFERVLDEGHITNLAVSKDDQRRGIASKLVNHVLDIAKGSGIKEIFLEVRHSNEAAIKLYNKFGFAAIGRRKGYYQKANDDALVLKLDLSGEKIEGGS